MTPGRNNIPSSEASNVLNVLQKQEEPTTSNSLACLWNTQQNVCYKLCIVSQLSKGPSQALSFDSLHKALSHSTIISKVIIVFTCFNMNISSVNARTYSYFYNCISSLIENILKDCLSVVLSGKNWQPNKDIHIFFLFGHGVASLMRSQVQVTSEINTGNKTRI